MLWTNGFGQSPTRAATLDHVAISVASAEASARFYEGAFGFVELKNPFAGGGGVVWLDLGNGIALHLFGGRKSPVLDERERHMAVTVPDIARVTDFLRSHDVAWQDFDGVPGRVQTRPDGVHPLFFKDPEGYWVEVNDVAPVAVR